jgi:hypothetical protein
MYDEETMETNDEIYEEKTVASDDNGGWKKSLTRNESEQPSTPAPAPDPAASTNDVLAQYNEAKVLFLAVNHDAKLHLSRNHY